MYHYENLYIIYFSLFIFVSIYIFIKNYTIIKGQLASFSVSHPPPLPLPLKLYVYCLTTHIYRGTFDENISKHDLLKSGLGNE